MFRQQKSLDAPKTLVCPECKSNRFLFKGSSVECVNCGHKEKGNTSNKFGAKRTESRDGIKRDSKFEAGVADELALRKKVGDIKDYESQYKIEAWAYRENGLKAFKVSHKIDFRILHNDGSYELVEAKGVETSDYKWRRKFLENIWLPDHPDHIYTVIKQQSRGWR
jgi:uncharacterized Zn finger protein (UPF0148 family)